MIHHNLTFAEYAALPGWSWSVIKHAALSPLAVQYARTHPGKDTATRAKLRAVHALVLEPHRFADEFSVYDGIRRGKAYDAHREQHPRTAVLNPSEMDEIRAAADAIHRHPAVARLLAEGQGEVSVTWTDRATGLPCKGRIDWLNPKRGFVDLKTSGTVHERRVGALSVRNQWHGQLAHYADGLRANGIDLPAWLITAEGKDANDVAVWEVDDGVPDGGLHIGATIRAEYLAIIARCVAEDDWPGRHPHPQPLTLPTYALLDPEISADESISTSDDHLEF